MNTVPFHILLALSRSDAPAVGLLNQINEDTSSTLVVAERTFYATLPVLLRRNWIAKDGHGRGAQYSLTTPGRRQLQVERARLGRAVTLLHERL